MDQTGGLPFPVGSLLFPLHSVLLGDQIFSWFLLVMVFTCVYCIIITLRRFNLMVGLVLIFSKSLHHK